MCEKDYEHDCFVFSLASHYWQSGLQFLKRSSLCLCFPKCHNVPKSFLKSSVGLLYTAKCHSFSSNSQKHLTQHIINEFSLLSALLWMSAECEGKTSWLKREIPIYHLTSSSIFLSQASSAVSDWRQMILAWPFFIPFPALKHHAFSLNTTPIFPLSYDQECWFINVMTIMHCVLQEVGWHTFHWQVEQSQSCLCTLSSVAPEGWIAILRSE